MDKERNCYEQKAKVIENENIRKLAYFLKKTGISTTKRSLKVSE